jgi:hypothetical protein
MNTARFNRVDDISSKTRKDINNGLSITLATIGESKLSQVRK